MKKIGKILLSALLVTALLLSFYGCADDKENNNLLLGEWVGTSGSYLLLRSDGSCVYTELFGGANTGTWYVESDMLYVEGVSDYSIYADVSKIDEGGFILEADYAYWGDEYFTKKANQSSDYDYPDDVEDGYEDSAEPDTTGSDVSTPLIESEGLKFSIAQTGDYCILVGIGSCTDTNIVIPSTYYDLPVTEIRERAFMHCESLTSVTIPDSVTSIGNEAFYKCTSLTSVTIGNGVTSIGNEAFYECTSLTSITIPDSVTSIGYGIGFGAFDGCDSLESVYITDIASWCNISFLNNGSRPLSNGAKLYLNGELVTDLIIPDSVTSIGGLTFSGCTSLTSVTIPDSVTSIDGGAFSNCDSLTSVTIPDSVTSIDGGAFRNCYSLTSITIPDSVTDMGSEVFANCLSLKDIYCEATGQPEGWSESWKDYCPATVHWGS